MIGLLLISHDAYGEALIRCAQHVLHAGPPQLACLGVSADEDPAGALDRARALLAEVDTGEGVLVMTDAFGATPANIALKLLDPGRVEGLSGANLPMLLRALTYRDRDMATLLAKAISGGQDGIVDMARH